MIKLVTCLLFDYVGSYGSSGAADENRRYVRKAIHLQLIFQTDAKINFPAV
jgi:hypothetical protein